VLIEADCMAGMFFFIAGGLMNGFFFSAASRIPVIRVNWRCWFSLISFILQNNKQSNKPVKKPMIVNSRVRSNAGENTLLPITFAALK